MADLFLPTTDIRRAVTDGVLRGEDADRLLEWAGRTSPAAAPQPREAAKGFNAVSIAYYAGALLMISACAWFLTNIWAVFGDRGVLATTLVYAAVLLRLGIGLRARGYRVAGGLLVTVAVSLTPLVAYTIEHMIGFWPAGDPGKYQNYYPLINGSWVILELSTIATAAIALRYVPFGFLVAPLAFSFWFFSMDLAALLVRVDALGWNERCWVSVLVGAATIAIGYGLERSGTARRDTSEDFAFWCYLFGLMAFSGGLSAMTNGSQAGKLVYCLIHVGLIVAALRLRRATFLVFGALGCWVYVAQLAYNVFKDSVLFPFVLAMFGLGMILTTVWAQRRWVSVTGHTTTASA